MAGKRPCEVRMARVIDRPSRPAPRGLTGSDRADPLDLPQDGVQSVPPDELHGVVMEAVVLADPIDRNDVRVVQPGRGAGLATEPLQPGRVAEVMEGKRLQSHVPAQRFLDRLVDDPHAAGADAAEQEVVTQALGHRVT